jgi:hypothetical protein
MKEIIYKTIEFIFWLALSIIYFYRFHNSGDVMYLVCGMIVFISSVLSLVNIMIKLANEHHKIDKEDYEAINTVLRTLEIKDEYFKLIDFLLVDYDGCKSVETLKELIDETRDYIHKALKNDDKSVIYRRGDDKGLNILGEEVE